MGHRPGEHHVVRFFGSAIACAGLAVGKRQTTRRVWQSDVPPIAASAMVDKLTIVEAPMRDYAPTAVKEGEQRIKRHLCRNVRGSDRGVEFACELRELSAGRGDSLAEWAGI